MSRRTPDAEAWIDRLPDDQRQRASQLADLVREAAGPVDEAVKWGRLTFTVDDDWHHWLCAIGTTRSEVKLFFHKGALLDDPDGLLEGDGRYLRHVRHDAARARPGSVTRLVREAVSRQTDMIDD